MLDPDRLFPIEDKNPFDCPLSLRGCAVLADHQPAWAYGPELVCQE